MLALAAVSGGRYLRYLDELVAFYDEDNAGRRESLARIVAPGTDGFAFLLGAVGAMARSLKATTGAKMWVHGGKALELLSLVPSFERAARKTHESHDLPVSGDFDILYESPADTSEGYWDEARIMFESAIAYMDTTDNGDGCPAAFQGDYLMDRIEEQPESLTFGKDAAENKAFWSSLRSDFRLLAIMGVARGGDDAKKQREWAAGEWRRFREGPTPTKEMIEARMSEIRAREAGASEPEEGRDKGEEAMNGQGYKSLFAFDRFEDWYSGLVDDMQSQLWCHSKFSDIFWHHEMPHFQFLAPLAALRGRALIETPDRQGLRISYVDVDDDLMEDLVDINRVGAFEDVRTSVPCELIYLEEFGIYVPTPSFILEEQVASFLNRAFGHLGVADGQLAGYKCRIDLARIRWLLAFLEEQAQVEQAPTATISFESIASHEGTWIEIGEARSITTEIAGEGGGPSIKGTEATLGDVRNLLDNLRINGRSVAEACGRMEG